MPELPEVQTIISDLNKKIKGDIIVGFWSDWPKALNPAHKNLCGGVKGIKFSDFKKEIKGKKIVKVERIGKNIFLRLSGGKTLYMHLKMTGHLLVKSGKGKEIKDYFSERVNQYIHHIWYLKSGRTLEFSDLRKFGKIILGSDEKINNLPEIRKLGTDAMSLEFSLKKFKEIMEKRGNRPIAEILIDQNSISGIGNIYRSEILYKAGILPQRKVRELSDKEIRRIFSSIKKILKKAIKLRGTSDSDYRDTSGAPGGFQKVIKVYRREGKKCEKCGTLIRRIKMGQRSVFFCPVCQK